MQKEWQQGRSVFRKPGRSLIILILLILCLIISGCSRKEKETPADTGTGSDPGSLVIGFSQLGSESAWRLGNTESM